MKDNALISYLGANSYPAVVSTIFEKIKTSEASTLTGNKILSDAFQTLNESITPILELKEFTTNAQQLAPNDAKLSEIVNFVKKQVKGGDMNFLINLCKEEHYKNVSRTGHPSPQQTIKEIESSFYEPSNVIEAGIKKGLFDSLQSNMLMNVKSDLIEDPSKNPINKNTELKVDNLNESTIFDNHIAIYSPIAIKMENLKNNNIVFLTESCVLEINGDTKDLCQISDLGSVEIPMAHRSLMTAISNLKYDPTKTSFSLNQDWDFELELLSTGEITFSKMDSEKAVLVEINDLPSLLLESINAYAERVPNFNRIPYTLDADNFIMLAENHGKLMNLDEYKTIKNLETSEYVIVNLNESKPNLIASSTGLSQKPENFQYLVESISSIVNNNNIHQLFESQLRKESDAVALINGNIQKLNEEQKEINLLITKNRNLKAMADEDSPIMQQLFEQETNLKIKVDANLESLSAEQEKLEKLYS